MKKFIFALMFFALAINVKAYETTNYKIDIPSTYTDNNGIYTLKENDKTTTISIKTDKNDTDINIDKLTKKNLKKDKYISSIEKSLKKFNDSVVINSNSIDLVEINNHKLIKFDITTVSQDEYKSTVYQTQYISSSKNYVYYIVVSSSSKEDLSSKEIKSIINSFTMKDEFFNHKEKMVKYYIIISSIGLLWIILYCIFRKKK